MSTAETGQGLSDANAGQASTGVPTSPTGSRSRASSSGVVIACRPCRFRKIRCDSTRPKCINCIRRSTVCEYDATVKRRGPDKNPGTRQRSCKKRPSLPADNLDSTFTEDPKPKPRNKRMKIQPPEPIDTGIVLNNPDIKKEMHTPTDTPSLQHGLSIMTAVPRLSSQASYSPIDYPLYPMQHVQNLYPQYPIHGLVSPITDPLTTNLSFPTSGDREHMSTSISPLTHSRHRLWWDDFLRTYSLQQVEESLTFIITQGGNLFNFLNHSAIVNALYSSPERMTMQPSFILAVLAVAHLMQSAQVSRDDMENAEIHELRAETLRLREDAQALLETTLEAGDWINAELTAAALLLAIFEMSPHPKYHPDRMHNALVSLDSIIHRLRLTSLDAGDPDVSIFPRHSVPVVETLPAYSAPQADSYQYEADANSTQDRRCVCFSQQQNMQRQPDPFNSYSQSLSWDLNSSNKETKSEQNRRICWTALALVSNYNSLCAALENEKDPPVPGNFWLSDPSNWSLLFPGEANDRVSLRLYGTMNSFSAKDSIWALYCRSMLLWNFCYGIRVSNSRQSHSPLGTLPNGLTAFPSSTAGVSDEDLEEFACEAWNESQHILDALAQHVCNLDTALIYMSREYVHNTCMVITQVLRSSAGLSAGPLALNRRQAEQWIYSQNHVVNRVQESLQGGSLSAAFVQLTRRPFQVSWFIHQLALCLRLWNNDGTLLIALQLAKNFLLLVDWMNHLWPSEYFHQQTDALRQRLVDCCSASGQSPPLSRSPVAPP